VSHHVTASSSIVPAGIIAVYVRVLSREGPNDLLMEPGSWAPEDVLALSKGEVIGIVLSPGQVSGGDGVDPRVVR
jgi:hypothetical protein